MSDEYERFVAEILPNIKEPIPHLWKTLPYHAWNYEEIKTTEQFFEFIKEIVELYAPLPESTKLDDQKTWFLLSILFSKGISTMDILQILKEETENIQYQKLFDQCRDEVLSGGGLGDAFKKSGLFKPEFCEAMTQSEQEGNLEDYLNKGEFLINLL